MAGAGEIPRLIGPNDPKGIDNYEALKDSYKVKDPGEDAMDIRGAGLNGYGDFIIVGQGLQIIRVPDKDRAKLAAYLMAPLLDTEPIKLQETVNRQMQEARSEKEVPARLRAQNPESRPRKGGVVARP